MTASVPDKRTRFSKFKTAAEEAGGEGRGRDETGQPGVVEDGGPSAHFLSGSSDDQDGVRQCTQSPSGVIADAGPLGANAPISEAEVGIDELALALYAQDIRLGIVREADILNADGALSSLGEEHYLQRAVAILESLAEVSDAEIIEASMAEPANSPRGAAARGELIRRGLPSV